MARSISGVTENSETIKYTVLLLHKNNIKYHGTEKNQWSWNIRDNKVENT